MTVPPNPPLRECPPRANWGDLWAPHWRHIPDALHKDLACTRGGPVRALLSPSSQLFLPTRPPPRYDCSPPPPINYLLPRWGTLRSRSLHLGTQQSLKTPCNHCPPFRGLSCHTLRGPAENVPTPPPPTATPPPPRLRYDIPTQVRTLKPHTATLTHRGDPPRTSSEGDQHLIQAMASPHPQKVLSLAPRDAPV